MSSRYAPSRPRVSTAPLVALVEGVGFWIAVVLPFLYVPALVVHPPAATLVVVAVVLNLVALVVGHGHRQREVAATDDIPAD